MRKGGSCRYALASRSTLIAPSATLAMAGEAKKLKSQGVDVLDFALGEPDFRTPDNIQQAAIRAMKSGQTHYTPAAGIPELRRPSRSSFEAEWLADGSGPGRHLERCEALDP